MASDPAATAGDPDAFAELHYYSGGLRHLAITATGERPGWAAPADWVGFRDEFPLRDGGYAVEFRRIAAAGRLTWLAVYVRSIDQKFGDRGNHIGVGLWACDRSIARPDQLLGGLRTLVDRFAADPEPDVIADHVRRFVSGFVPRYLAPLDRLPAELGGMAFATSQLTDTVRWATTSDAEGWRRVADKIAELGLLAPDDGSAARVVIGLSAEPAGPLLDRDGGPFARLAAVLPAALAGIDAARTTAVGDIAALRVETATLHQQLTADQSQIAALTAELREAKADAARFDRDFTPSLAAAFAGIDARLGRIERAVERAPRAETAVAATRPVPVPRSDDGAMGWRELVTYIVLIVVAAAVIVGSILYFRGIL